MLQQGISSTFLRAKFPKEGLKGACHGVILGDSSLVLSLIDTQPGFFSCIFPPAGLATRAGQSPWPQRRGQSIIIVVASNGAEDSDFQNSSWWGRGHYQIPHEDNKRTCIRCKKDMFLGMTYGQKIFSLILISGIMQRILQMPAYNKLSPLDLGGFFIWNLGNYSMGKYPWYCLFNKYNLKVYIFRI